MGVTGLLQQLKDIQEKTTLSKYKGKTLAVDTYGWLHRGLISCAQDLCTDVPTKGYVTSVLKKVDMVRHFGVEPLMVFDGSPLPTKEGTHLERRARRETAREAASRFLARGNRKAAWKEFMKAAAVTPEMAKSVMVELDRRRVKYVVAPYEADPQMVYLEKIGAVDGILSEDSDLLVFGCNKLITKLNDYGECIEISRENFCKVKNLSLHNLSQAQWRLVAILSGCDYTKGIPGVGLKTAFQMVQKLPSLEKIILALKADNKSIPEDFTEEALRADLAFRYQKVFNPFASCLTTLTEIEPDSALDQSILDQCCGRRLEAQVQAGICTGKLHPESHEPLISREQCLTARRSKSMSLQKQTSSYSNTSSNKFAHSFSSSRSIESYFQTDKGSLNINAATKSNVLECTANKSIKLSPSSKKLKRFNPDSTAPNNTHSKFFKSHSSMKVLKLVETPKLEQADPDSSLFTGDSEVPESSSPLKLIQSDCLTDDDNDKSSLRNSMVNSALSAQSFTSESFIAESDQDDGYVNELDESPVKISKVGLLWRERFSMSVVSDSDLNSARNTQTSSKRGVTSFSTKSMSPPRTGSGTESTETSSSPNTSEADCREVITIGTCNKDESMSIKFTEKKEEKQLSISNDKQKTEGGTDSTAKLRQFAFAGY